MGMEGPGAPEGPENLDELKQKILEEYRARRNTEELDSMLDEWVNKKYEAEEQLAAVEEDRFKIIESRIRFGLERVDLYREIGWEGTVLMEELKDLRDEAKGARLAELVIEINEKIYSLEEDW